MLDNLMEVLVYVLKKKTNGSPCRKPEECLSRRCLKKAKKCERKKGKKCPPKKIPKVGRCV